MVVVKAPDYLAKPLYFSPLWTHFRSRRHCDSLTNIPCHPRIRKFHLPQIPSPAHGKSATKSLGTLISKLFRPNLGIGRKVKILLVLAMLYDYWLVNLKDNQGAIQFYQI